MGWKNIKEHYRISHYVQVTQKGICIGSPYIHDIIVIGMDGVFKKRYDGAATNLNLQRYQYEMDGDPSKLKKLLWSEDKFDKSVTVYTYDDGEILEKLCEEPGWPNVTHDGKMMYDNEFSTDKAKVVKWAKENAEAGVEISMGRVAEAKAQLVEASDHLLKAARDLDRLEKEYPEKVEP